MPAATLPASKSSDSSNNPFVKSLASSNRTTRDRALDSLRTYLNRATTFSELDLLKLWKGLYFCMWMSDKPLNQQRLARDLAGLVDALRGRENVLGWFRAFWKTMAREWSGVDALRMDKFLYLVRCYVGKGFESLRRGTGWSDNELLEQYLEVLEEVPLNVADGKIPNGIRFHVIDIYVDELDKVDVDSNAPLDELLSPMRTLGDKSLTKVVRERTKEALADERLQDWKNRNAKQESEDISGGEKNDEAANEEVDFAGFDD